MQSPLIYQLSGNLMEGRYMPGQYQWAQPVRLGSATVLAAMMTEPFTLALEVAGQLTGDTVTVTSEQMGELVVLVLDNYIPAGSVVRWLCQWPADAVGAPMQVQVMMSWSPAGNQPVNSMVVNWRNGLERLTLFTYSAGAFMDVSDGLSSGRVSIATAGGFKLAVGGVPTLEAINATLFGSDFNVGEPVPDGPMAQLVINGVVVATAQAGAFYVNQLTEEPSLPGGLEFQLADQNGFVVAVVGIGGMAVESLVEGPLP